MKEHLNAIIIAVAILLAVVIYCFGTRYRIVAAGAGEASVSSGYIVDRITGETWAIGGPRKIKHDVVRSNVDWEKQRP